MLSSIWRTLPIDGVDFICANTDSQALKSTDVKTVLQLGNDITKGLGAGSNPVVGREAALEDQDRISESISGADMLFITAGMGGGTGTGAAPVVAEIAEELGVLTVAVVTKPFEFEGKKRHADCQCRHRGAGKACRFLDHDTQRETAIRSWKRYRFAESNLNRPMTFCTVPCRVLQS